tara:strand:- start:12180 stop:13046 length:867 start_codon:yes stop_codon:yes gene_type:complete
MSNFYTPQEAIAKVWELSQKHPAQQPAYLSKLEDEYGVTVEEYNEYDSTMISNKEVKVMQDRLHKKEQDLKDIPLFSQSLEMSDAEIIRTFDSLYELEEKQRNVDRVPYEAEWYKAGAAAQEKIDVMEGPYKVRKAEEWKLLTESKQDLDPVEKNVPPFLSDILGSMVIGSAGLTHQMLFGWMDALRESKDLVAHERDEWTLNPFTGFGMWDLAEMRWNPETEDWGFSPDLLNMEQDLEDLYVETYDWKRKMEEGNYSDLYTLDKEHKALMATLPEGVIDPRKYGEIE